MTTPIIKKSQMKPAEWTSLVDVLRRVDVRKAAAIVQDNKVTDKEMNKLLDRNSDGKVTYQDFSSIQNTLFGKIKGLLQKHKLSAFGLWQPSTGNLPSVPGQFWSDRDFVIAAMKQDPGLLKYAIKEVVLAVVKRAGMALRYASTAHRKDKEVVLAAVKDNGQAFKYADASFRKDKEVVLAVMKVDIEALKYADASLKRNKEFVLAAVKSDYEALEYAAPALRKDKELIFVSIKNTPLWQLQNADETVWRQLLGDVELSKFFTVMERKNETSFFAALNKKYNIQFPYRFNKINALIEVLKNRQTANAPNDNRPLCIIIYPKTDGNGAFEIDSNIGQMIKLGYRVIYHEAGDEREVAKYLKSATANGKYPAKTIILGGHGTSTSLALGGEDGRWDTYNEHLYIDTGDFKGKDELQLARYLQPGGDLLLNSCSNGAGGASNQANLANTIARTLYSGILVHSYTMLSFGSSIRVVGGGLKVKLNGDSGYRVWGSKPRPPATAPLPAVKVQCEMLPEWDII